jgi:hypothetical protein
MAKPMPAIFFGHGNPMNALAHNSCTDGWAAIGKDLPRPRAVLCVSAHWYLPATLVAANRAPRTIHDFAASRVSCTKSITPRPAIRSLRNASKKCSLRFWLIWMCDGDSTTAPASLSDSKRTSLSRYVRPRPNNAPL